MALNKLPDIDLDFPHDRKDDVVDLVFRRYGTTHAAVVGGFSTFQARSSLAEIGKVLGLSDFQVRRLTEHVPNVSAGNIEEALNDCIESQSEVFAEEPAKTALKLASLLDGFPRYPKMHPCGMVLSCDPILHHSPTFTSAKGYPTTHFDMDSVEAVGLVKLDILAQGGLAVMRDTRAMLADRGVSVDLDALEPWQDSTVWEMIATGNARGVHHIESPAMITLEKMCDVRDINVLVAIVSVRAGLRCHVAHQLRDLVITNLEDLPHYVGRASHVISIIDPEDQEFLRLGLVVHCAVFTRSKTFQMWSVTLLAIVGSLRFFSELWPVRHHLSVLFLSPRLRPASAGRISAPVLVKRGLVPSREKPGLA